MIQSIFPYRNILSVVCIVLLSLGMMALSGCSDSIAPDMSEDDVQVTLRLDEAFQEKAYIRVNHDGSQDDFWYYIVTEDMESDPQELLAASLEEALAAEGKILGNVGTNKNVTLENLDAKTTYRVIAARILPDGSITGNVAELVFTTLRNPDVFEAHPEWSIVYKERRASEEDPNVENEIFVCSTGDSQDTYVPCLLSKSDFEVSYGGNLRRCFEDYVAYRNLNNVKWPNIVLSTGCEHVEDRLRHGDYILFMIGVDKAGELTGYYARTDCRISQETASEAYSKWVGKWTAIGYCGDRKITYSLEISPDENNLYYRMSGWESASAAEYFASVPQELPILLYFEKTTGDVYVVSEAMKDLEDPTLSEFYDFYMYGCVEIDYQGVPTEVPVDVENLRIAKFSLYGDDYAEVTPEIFSFDLNGVHYDAPFLYFNYSYISMLYQGLVPVTTDSIVPRISTMRLER